MGLELVFDLDGTLVDSRAHLIRYQRELFAFLGRPFPEHQLELFFSLDRHALEAAVFHPAELPRVDAFRKSYPYRDRLGEIVPKPGADTLLAALAESGRRLGLLTNRGTSTRPLLEQLDWGTYFDPVLAAVDLERPKPAPMGLERIAAAWRVDPTELVYVGDTDLDVACARAAGATAVTVGTEPIAGCHHHVADLAELEAWLAAELGVPAIGG